MKISIINSDSNHPINPFLNNFIDELKSHHELSLVRLQSELDNGHILFLISCVEKISPEVLQNFNKTFVIHASDLPQGRGWSPHIWQLLSGAEEVVLSMIEASPEIDSGDIWLKEKIQIPQDALWDEINEILFSSEIELMRYAVNNYKTLTKSVQAPEVEPTYFRKRKLSDSKIDVNKSIEQQFNLIRACDPNRYPAYLELYGSKYKLVLEKMNND